ncbi:hypothetical protein BD309DRAFT_5903 [Dichomitus squalens]|nr:hypothetical protein BD309DRAFT_5903 [Dichomitus squalens]
MDVQLVDISSTPGTPNAFTSALGLPLTPLDGLTEPVMSTSPFMPPVSSSTRQQDQANTSQPDLIAFDSFSTPNASHLNALSGSTPSRDSAAERAPASVDDLLSMSPRPTPPIVDVHASGGIELLVQEEHAATPDDEMEVVNPIVVEVAPPRSSPPLIGMSLAEEATLETDAAPPLEEASEFNKRTPPLRRSTRPRKSRNSLPQTIANTSPQPLIPDQQFQPEGSSAERRLKPSPSPEDKGEGTSIAVPSTPRRLTQVARVQRDLGSLSPMSAAVLSQLVPRAAGGSGSGKSTPLPPPPQRDGNASSMGPILTPAPKTPPEQQPAFIFPTAGPAAEPEPGAQRPKSPLRPFSPFKFGEGSRTPARRVPIAQAVTEGTYSPNKLPAAFGATRPANAPGSPVFKKVALDDPLRSPAKRVPMSEAVLVPPPSPGKTLDKGKSKAIPRLQSPNRASSVPPRERTASAEPPLLARRGRGASAEPVSRPLALGSRPLFQKPASSDGIPSSAAKLRTALPFPLQQHRVPSIPEGDEPVVSSTRPASAVPRGARAGVRATSALPVASPAKQGSSLRQPSAGSGSKIPRIGAKPYARPKSEAKTAAASKPPTLSKGGLASSKTMVSNPSERVRHLRVRSELANTPSSWDSRYESCMLAQAVGAAPMRDQLRRKPLLWFPAPH